MNMVPVNTVEAGIIKTRGPNLSKSWPMKGDIIPFKILPGRRRSPAVAAVRGSSDLA